MMSAVWQANCVSGRVLQRLQPHARQPPEPDRSGPDRRSGANVSLPINEAGGRLGITIPAYIGGGSQMSAVAALAYTYRYPFASDLVPQGAGAGLRLATSGGAEPCPYFFRGRLEQPRE